jgi:hypothetical protein
MGRHRDTMRRSAIAYYRQAFRSGKYVTMDTVGVRITSWAVVTGVKGSLRTAGFCFKTA